jgi:hypothetical protein
MDRGRSCAPRTGRPPSLAELAEIVHWDWRDTLMAAGFGQDLEGPAPMKHSLPSNPGCTRWLMVLQRTNILPRFARVADLI